MDGVWALIFLTALANEVLTGVIRYYSALAGAAPLAYVPKALMVAFSLYALASRPKISHFLVALYFALQICVALSHDITLNAIGFWGWLISPLIFVMLAPTRALDLLDARSARVVFCILALLAMGGVWLNLTMVFPWTDSRLSIGSTNLVAAESTYDNFGVLRLAGFGRSYASTGLIIGLLTTWVLPSMRSRVTAGSLLALSALSLWETTDKTSLVAVALTSAFLYFGKLSSIKNTCILLAAIMLILPIAAFVANSAFNNVYVGSGSLASLNDRVDNTWPSILEDMLQHGLLWLGVGPGGFGSVSFYYSPLLKVGRISASDNAALYAFVNFGIVGIVLSALLLVRYVLSSQSTDKRLWLMLLFLLSSGITLDIFESLGCLLFLGLTIKLMQDIYPHPSTSPIVSRRRMS